MRPCSAFRVHELNGLVRALWAAAQLSPINKLYAPDDGRALRHQTLEAYDKEFSAESLISEDNLRPFKCAEAVNLYIHQLTNVTRAALLQNASFQLPTLHVASHSSSDPSNNTIAPPPGDLPCSYGHQNVPYPYNWIPPPIIEATKLKPCRSCTAREPRSSSTDATTTSTMASTTTTATETATTTATNSVDPPCCAVPRLEIPAFEQPPAGLLDGTGSPPPPPAMPKQWQMTVLLHPMAPTYWEEDRDQPVHITATNALWYELCIATLTYTREALHIQVASLQQHRDSTWWFVVRPGDDLTSVSYDKGLNWQLEDWGWRYPIAWFSEALETRFDGSMALNWLEQTEPLTWWKQVMSQGPPVDNGWSTSYSMQTWFYANRTPRRWIYSCNRLKLVDGKYVPAPYFLPPLSTTSNLPFLQLYSMTDVAEFTDTSTIQLPTQYHTPHIEGLSVPDHIPLIQWPLSVTINMVDTSYQYEDRPFPTQIHYNWVQDELYDWKRTSRVHVFNITNIYQPEDEFQDLGWMYGLSPPNSPAPFPNSSGTNRWVTPQLCREGAKSCLASDEQCAFQEFPAYMGGGIGMQPPWWMSIPAAYPVAAAVIKDHPRLSPGHTLGIYSLLWPKGPGKFNAAGGFAWKHYTIDDAKAAYSTGRPVVFNLGYSYSVGVADYLDWEVYSTGIEPLSLQLPKICNGIFSPEGVTPDLRTAKPMHKPPRRGFSFQAPEEVS